VQWKGTRAKRCRSTVVEIVNEKEKVHEEE